MTYPTEIGKGFRQAAGAVNQSRETGGSVPGGAKKGFRDAAGSSNGSRVVGSRAQAVEGGVPKGFVHGSSANKSRNTGGGSTKTNKGSNGEGT